MGLRQRSRIDGALRREQVPSARIGATADDVRKFAWPDVTADDRYEGLAERIDEYHRRGYAVTGELYMTIFERAWLMRGMEQLLMDFLAEPEMGHAICQCIADLRIEQARRLAGLGVDVLRLGDDVCTQKGLLMSRGTYRTFLKERTRAIIRAAKEVKPDLLVFMHCDGRVEDMVEEYVDIGIDILNPVQPECNVLRRSSGEPADASLSGAASERRAPCRLARPATWHRRWLGRKRSSAATGACWWLLRHILEPEVPWDNIVAFVEAARTRFTIRAVQCIHAPRKQLPPQRN